MCPLRRFRFVPLALASLLLVLLVPSTDAQREYIARVNDDGALVVQERPVQPGEAAEDVPFSLQEEVDRSSRQGLTRVMFEVDGFVFQSRLRLRRNLTITSNLPNSAKTELSCGNGTRLFHVKRGGSERVAVVFENVRITNCAATKFKGVIHVGSRTTVSFNNVEISNNVAEGDETAVLTADSGSEINILQNSSFTNNTGRVLLVEGNSTVLTESSSFVNNTAGINGSVLATKSGQGMIALTIRGNSIFESNRVNNGNGGVFWLENSNLTVEKGVRFTNNAAQHSGGAIYMLGITGMHVSDTVFDHNACLLGRGGALYISPEQSESTVTIERSVFSRNRATGILGIGGAIFYGLTDLEQNRSLFLSSDVMFWRNLARLSAGAVIVSNTKANASFSSIFVANVALGEGGAVYFESPEEDTEGLALIRGNVIGSSFLSNVGRIRGGGAISALKTVHLNIVSVNFTGNIAHQAGAVFLNEVLDVQITSGTTFFHHFVFQSGGCIVAYRGKSVGIDNSTFANNTATQRGGSLNVWETERLTISNSTFRGNNASITGGAISIGNPDDQRIRITTMSLSGVEFVENRCPPVLLPDERNGHGGAIRIFQVGVRTEISNCTFRRNEGNLGGAMYLDETYAVRVDDTIYVENRAEFGGAVHLIPSERVLQSFQDFSVFTDCRFTKNQATKGGAIYARSNRLNNEVIPSQSPSVFSINNSQVSENKAIDAGGGIHLAGMTVELRESQFIRNTIGSTNAEDTERANREIGDGGAIYGTYGSVINAEGTSFINNTALKQGGAVSLQDALFNGTMGCRFVGNDAQRGGGVFGSISIELVRRDQTAMLHCKDCIFQANSADFGGGIYALIPPNIAGAKIESTCMTALLTAAANSTFSDSNADCQDFVYLENWDAIINSASETGHFIFTTQPLLVIVSENGTKENLVDFFKRTRGESGSEDDLGSIACNFMKVGKITSKLNRGDTGEELSALQFTVNDCFNKPHQGAGIIIEIRACEGDVNCCPGTNISTDSSFRFFSPNTKTVFEGKADFRGLDISDGKFGNTERRLWACFEDHGDDPAVLDPIPVNVSFRGCYKLEKPNTGGRNGCSVCDSGQYYLQKTTNCTLCPENADCERLTIVPDEGYWHASSSSGNIHKCHPQKACSTNYTSLQSNATMAHQDNRTLLYNDSEYDQCRAGYEGLRCGTCSRNYGRWITECIKCFKAWRHWLILVGIIVWNLVALLVFIYSARTLVDKVYFNQQTATQQTRLPPKTPKPASSHKGINKTSNPGDPCTSSQSLEVNLDGLEVETPPDEEDMRFQTANRTTPGGPNRTTSNADPLPLANPLAEAFKIFLNFMQVIYLASLVSEGLPDVFRWSVIPIDGFNFAESGFLMTDCLLKGLEERTITRMTLQVLFPVFLMLFLCFFSFLFTWRGKKSKFGFRELRLIMLCTIYFFFGPVVRTLLEFLDHEEVKDDLVELYPASFWAIDSSVKFMSGTHAYIVGFLVLPLLFCLTIAFPLILFVALRRKKAAMQDEEVISSYGFLYKGYEQEYYFWEIIIIFRKTILAVISVFAKDRELQATFFCFALVFFLSLQLIIRPFTSNFPRLNELEGLSLAMSVLIFFGVIVMLRSDTADKSTLRNVVAVLLLLFLVATMVIMIVELYVAAQEFLSDKLVEHQICEDKRKAKAIPFNKKTYKLAHFYIDRFLARFIEARKKRSASV